MTSEASSAAAAISASDPAPASGAAPAPQRRRRWEAADTVVAASIALVALIVGIFVLLCIQGFYTTIENTKERVQTAASIVAEETRWVFATAHASLDHLARQAGDGSPEALARMLSDAQAETASAPMRMRIEIYDASGTLVAGGDSGAPAEAGIAGREFFEAVAGGQPWSLSAYQNDPQSGEDTFAVARRLEADGVFTGVAVAIIGAEVLHRFAEPHNLGPGSTISVIRADGWVIARNPPLSEPMNVSGMPNFTTIEEAGAGSYESAASPVDGVTRIVGFNHVPEFGYIAIASIARETALAGLWNSILIVSLLIAPIAVALLAGSLITARLLRRSEATGRSLAAALEHNERLFREIHHRVKNNLQSVNSLLQLQPIPRSVRADMSQRIAAMSAVHEHIYRSETFSQVRVKAYLHTLIENIRAGHDPGVTVIEDIEEVAVDKDAATPLGLIVNEVVSNSFKHAFADGRTGTVRVSLKSLGDGRAILTVSDNGVGFDPEAPAKGIGRRLIAGFTSQLQGEASQVNDNGSVFTLTFPVAKGTP